MTRAVILVNLGTPDRPEPGAVRRYLRQFLSDPRVVEAPRLLWWLILRLFILPVRARRVARLYRSIWQDDSPIRTMTVRQAQRLAAQLGVPVYAAMTYGNPALPAVLDAAVADGADELIVLPLYPQYSGSTTGAVADVVARWMGGRREVPTLHLVRDYWQESSWQRAIVASIRDAFARHGEPDRLLFSFHGIPLSYQERGDRYGDRCRASAAAIAEALGLAPERWQIAFQSRFGPQPWLQPYTDVTLREWGADEHVSSVHVVCPGFAADCLETLEEIAVQNRDLFLVSGGRSFHYIPALNDGAAHIDALAAVCRNIWHS